MSVPTALLSLLLLAAASKATSPLFKAVDTLEDETAVKVDYRLPTYAKPLHYQLHLQPRLSPDFDYTGTLEVRLKVTDHTDTLIMHAKGLKIDTGITLMHTVVEKDKDGKDTEVRKTIQAKPHTIDTVRDFLVIPFGVPLEAKEYTMHITFSGELSTGKRGFYRSSYLNADGEEKWLATTHFEPTGARLAFPCWDEPAYKATFEIIIKHLAKYKALSNTRGTGKPDGDFMLTTFEQTPPMSTYLVAFVVSDYEFVGDDDGVQKVWTKKQALDSANYALTVGKKVINHMNKYTGITYTKHMTKLDQISIPDFAPSAMENWGLVTYAEKALLYKDGVSTTANKQSITRVIAHELVHQWFGNLVTPSWWSYLWMKEGFATYLQYTTTNAFEEKWRMMDQFVVDDLQSRAFVKDAQQDTHPVNKEVKGPDDMKNLYDAIAYQKAGSLLRMLSHVLTEKVFQEGLKNYLKTNALGSVSPVDLLKELQKVAVESNKHGDDFDLNVIMKEWLEKPGYPVVHVKRNKENGDVSFTQERFAQDAADETKWWIPINYVTEGDINFEETKPSHWLKSDGKELTIKGLNSSQFLLVNKQQTGFYRVNYDEANWDLLAKFLQTKEFEKIVPSNRAQLIDDAFSLARFGKLNYPTALKLLSYLNTEKDYIPWVAAFRHLDFLNRMLINTKDYAKMKEYVRQQMAEIVKAVQFEANEKDEHITKLARPNVLKWACETGLEECTKHVNTKFNAWLEDAAKNPLDVDLKENILCFGVKSADEKTLNTVVKKYTDAAAKTQEKQQLLAAVSCSSSKPTLLNILYKSLEDKTGDDFDNTMKAFLANNPLSVDIALDVLSDNFTAIQKFDKDGSKMKVYLGKIADRVTAVPEYVKLGVFVSRKKLSPEISADAFSKAGGNLDWINQYSAPIISWMDGQIMKKGPNSAGTLSFNILMVLLPFMAARLLY